MSFIYFGHTFLLRSFRATVVVTRAQFAEFNFVLRIRLYVLSSAIDYKPY